MSEPRTIAVMQPYFFPYAGYFRLLAASDVFVLFDDVQFPRRGRVHRCEIAAGRWLTLPLSHQPRATLIKDLRWADGARTTLDERLAACGFARSPRTPMAQRLWEQIGAPLDAPVNFLEHCLRLTAEVLGLDTAIVRSSDLGIERTLRAQARVIAVVQALGGNRYLNAPGGRALYTPEAFRQADIELRFLAPYAGKYRYLLPALFGDDLDALRADVREPITLRSYP